MKNTQRQIKIPDRVIGVTEPNLIIRTYWTKTIQIQRHAHQKSMLTVLLTMAMADEHLSRARAMDLDWGIE